MAPKAAVSYTVILLGLGIYYITISALINARTGIVDRQVIFQGIDRNKDGRLSTKQIEAFNPCGTDFDKLNIKLHRLGKKITSGKFNSEITDVLIKKTLADCVSETGSLINPAKLSKKDVEEASEEFFELYDLDKNGVVGWKQYHSINSYNKKPLSNQKETFAFLDKNTDWRITVKEFAKSKLQKLKSKKQ